MFTTKTIIFCLCILPSVALSQATRPEISFNGYIDAFYSYNFNRPQPVTAPNASSIPGASLQAGNNTYRYYDIYHNQLSLSLAEISVQAKYEEVTGLFDLDFGSFADLNASASSPSGTVVDESSKHIGQAIISYRPKGSRLFFDTGKMYSHLGVETVKAKDNFNYSRSILFSYGMPFWNTGIRIGYDAVPEKFQTSLYVYNGWNTINDTNESKTLGLQLKYTPSSPLTLIYNFIGGPERPLEESDWKSVHEVNASYTINETWSLLADLIYGSEKNVTVSSSQVDAKWYGALVALKYLLSPTSFLSPRLEYYRDNDGYTLGGLPQSIQSFTLTYGTELTKGLEFRAEGRGDFSNESSFQSKKGTEKSQTTALVAMLFKF